MASTGLKYFWDKTILPVENIVSYFDFNVNSGNIITNPSWVTSGINGYLNNTSNFYLYSGSGNFNGSQYIKISGNVDTEEWSSLICYDKQNSETQILFSSLQGSSPSGFVVGVNQSNKLFMEYWNSVEGIQSIVFPTILGDKNIVGITKTDAQISFNYFNPNNKILTSTSVVPYGNNFIDSNQFYLGGSPVLPYFYSGVSNFSGQIDEFFLTSGSLLYEYINLLCSGLYSTRNTGTEISTSCIDISYVTGILQITGSGITGYQSIISNSITGACDTILYFYTNSGVSGELSGYVYSLYTGVSCATFTGTYDSGYFVDSGFLNTLGMNDITFLYNTDIYDNIIYKGKTGVLQDTVKNITPLFDLVQQNYYSATSYSGNFFNLFYNGQLQGDLGGYSYPNGYGIAYSISGDYLLTGSDIIDSGFYRTFGGKIFYDVIYNSRSYLITGAVSSGSSVGINFSNKNVFYNGILMMSGTDYTGNSFIFNIPSGYNLLTFTNVELDVLSNTGIGTGQYSFGTKYLRDTSQVWVNGVRQYLNLDYLESSRFDLLSGDFQNYSGGMIYSNTGDFWQTSL